MTVEQELVRRNRIVVGVDGSPSSKAALRWAVAQAEATHGVIEAIATWDYPPVYGWTIPYIDEDLEPAVGKQLAATVREVAGDRPEVEIEERVAQGNAAQVLLDAAEKADLLVLGNRGHGGFTGALLGSVGQHCVQHAACPVVIVRHAEG